MLKSCYRINSYPILLSTGDYYLEAPAQDQLKVEAICLDTQASLTWCINLMNAITSTDVNNSAIADCYAGLGTGTTTYPITPGITTALKDEIESITPGPSSPHKLYKVYVVTDCAPDDWWHGDDTALVDFYHYYIGNDRFGLTGDTTSAAEQLAQVCELFPKGSIKTLILASHNSRGAGSMTNTSSNGSIDKSIDPTIAHRIALRLSNFSTVRFASCFSGEDQSSVNAMAKLFETNVEAPIYQAYDFTSSGGVTQFKIPPYTFTTWRYGSGTVSADVQAARDAYSPPPTFNPLWGL